MKKILGLAALALLTACSGGKPSAPPLDLRPADFSELKDWGNEKAGEVIPTFLKSCKVWDKKAPDTVLQTEQTIRVKDWQTACAKAKALNPHDHEAARRYLEDSFDLFAAGKAGPNLFTGYYEASLEGARRKGGAYQTPLYAKPKDMIIADLGVFKPALKGQRIAGRVEKQKLVPYDKRASIAKGSLKGRAKPLVWVKDPVDAFFLEIQGSGRVRMTGGHEMRVGYAAQNGHEYVPIGRLLADRGEIERPVTMEKIRTWLAANPARAQKIMNENPSYVFFREIKGEGPVGAQGVALTPLRSLAVDPAFVPLGSMLWLETEKHNRLVVAQDTGGAIKGAVRGDLFWGHGEEAARGAGEMQEQGSYYLLLPKKAEGGTP